MLRRIGILAACLALGSPLPASATTFGSRSDNAIGAWDARTGELLWYHQPPALSDAWFELYPDTLRVMASIHADAATTEFELLLDPATGTQMSSSPLQGLLAQSRTWDIGEIVLENGLTLTNHHSGDKYLVFKSPGEADWVLDAQVESVVAWKNTVFWAKGYLSDDGLVHAHEARATEETWQLDVNQPLGAPAEPLTRPYLAVFGDVLFVGAHEHVFMLDPASGSLLHHWDLVALTGVPWTADEGPSFFHGGLDLATFAADDETLVVGFEGLVVAIDRMSRAVVWHADPGAFPHDPFPLVHGDKVYALMGNDAGPPKPPSPDEPKKKDGDCDCGVPGGRSPAPRGIAILGLALLLAMRLRRGPAS
jgi:hypothetical protein